MVIQDVDSSGCMFILNTDYQLQKKWSLKLRFVMLKNHHDRIVVFTYSIPWTSLESSILRAQSQFMLVIYFRLFLELDLVCQTGM
jgi:hypothetical protein